MRQVLLSVMLLIILRQTLFAQDWARLGRYRDSNNIVSRQPDTRDRVVFMGNSITAFWIRQSPDFFASNRFIDRGISGQTSPQMLLRFQQDVIALGAKAVVIECGTNDIAGNMGPSTLEMIEVNIRSMAELAKAHHIKVFLGSVLPAYAFYWANDKRPAEPIDSLNQWIRQYAARKHFYYIDYWSALKDERKGMRAQYSSDGVHPNKEGYEVMEMIAEPLIRKRIKKRK